MCLAIPGRIIDIDDGGELCRTGRVSFAGVVKEVNLAYVPEAEVGDYVLVHVGFAISRIDAAEAATTLRYLDEMGQLTEEIGEGSAS